MSRNGNIILIILTTLLLNCCTGDLKNTCADFKSKSIQISGEVEYRKVYQALTDSISNWALNGIGYFKFLGKEKNFNVDSLICFDTNGNRCVGALLTSHKNAAQADGIDFLYGEKIKENWYFFSGAYVTVPRSMVKNHEISKPLSYQELHEIALKEIYNGYLNSLGQIDENWFIRHFENVGMCGECKTREDFQKNIIEGVAAKWKYRDTTRSVYNLDHSSKPLP